MSQWLRKVEQLAECAGEARCMAGKVAKTTRETMNHRVEPVLNTSSRPSWKAGALPFCYLIEDNWVGNECNVGKLVNEIIG